jgi:uncharacterized protein YecT (DUF1311 family)
VIIPILISVADVPSRTFVQGCQDRAKTKEEIAFCAAGEQSEAQDLEEIACYQRDYSQQAMNMCAGDAYERADKRLNDQWAQLIDVIKDDKEAKNRLIDSQRAWIKYRDAWCDTAAWDNRGGTIWPLIHSSCLAQLTRDRVKQLSDELTGGGQ